MHVHLLDQASEILGYDLFDITETCQNSVLSCDVRHCVSKRERERETGRERERAREGEVGRETEEERWRERETEKF